MAVYLGETSTEITGNVDLNNVTSCGMYNVDLGGYWDSITNKPEGMNAAGLIIVTSGSSHEWRVQRIYAQNGQAWFRSIYVSDSQYNTRWSRCDDFGCNSLTALASALGANGLIPLTSWVYTKPPITKILRRGMLVQVADAT